MKNRLPVNIENLDLPEDEFKNDKHSNNVSYGYVNVLYLLSLIITLGSILTVVFFGK